MPKRQAVLGGPKRRLEEVYVPSRRPCGEALGEASEKRPRLSPWEHTTTALVAALGNRTVQQVAMVGVALAVARRHPLVLVLLLAAIFGTPYVVSWVSSW